MIKSRRIRSSEFNGIAGIEYFDFEEDFIEKNIRCIPMIVRFKLDAVRVKLKLDEWSKFRVNDRLELATLPCTSEEEIKVYRSFLCNLIMTRCGREATRLTIEPDRGWQNLDELPLLLRDKLKECELDIALIQWIRLTNLQRFSLLKLCKAGHESKNFPKAMQEFGLSGALTDLYRHYQPS